MPMKTYYENYLAHHGVKGMKWGVRRYQNPDGTLTEDGMRHLGKKVKKLEKKAIKKEYKRYKKNEGHYLFPSARRSTGKNFDEAEKAFEKKVLSDKKYQELSKKAFDTEKKRLLSEKPYSEDMDKYGKYIKTKKYADLTNASEKAGRAKEKYVEKMAKDYVDTIKEAKLKDLNITEHREAAKSFLSDKFNDFAWDGNLEYNPDHYYESWVDKKQFK